MANYSCTTRTNYFRVTDEAAYEKIFNNLCSESTLEDFTETKDGKIMHGFGCYSNIEYYIDSSEDADSDFDAFLTELQKILPDDEAFILFESGNEKLRYVTGYATIVTNKTIETLSIEDLAIKRCKELLGNDFTTQTTY